MDPKLFVSHSSGDSEIAERLVRLIEAGLVVRGGDIRCTSLSGYGLSGGDRTSDLIRSEIAAANVLLAILTKRGFASAWVLFEMGARWGQNKRIIPILGPGVSAGILRGPIVEFNALSCDDAGDLKQLLQDIAILGGFEHRTPPNYEEELAAVLNLRNNLVGPVNREKVLGFFRQHPDVKVRPGTVASELRLQKDIVREIARTLADQGELEVADIDLYGRIYKLAGSNPQAEQ